MLICMWRQSYSSFKRLYLTANFFLSIHYNDIINHFLTTFAPNIIPSQHAELSKIIKKVFPEKKKKKKIYFFSVSKNISSHVLKISLCTREITDMFNMFNEIYLLFTSKK